VQSLLQGLVSSLRMPRRAWITIAVVTLTAAAAVAAVRLAIGAPIDLSPLYYLNLVLVYGLQIGPVLVFALFALLRNRRPYPAHPPRVRFVCLVPAYNEARVIQNSVGSLMEQDYPRHLYEVYVVSDGSTDETDAVAAALGARVLRTDAAGFGKHRALAQAFATLLRGDADDRYVCVFDADNVVAPNYLAEMNSAICARGFRCLQCFHDVLNGPDNWITKGLWLNSVASSRLYNAGRHNGVGNALICGTGWCCEARLVQRYWAQIRTQTEDIELNGLLLLHEGIGVAWIPTTRIYDEKPLSLWVAIRQRHRWMTGHMRVAAFYAWPCLRAAFLRRDFRLAELASYYVLPFVMNMSNVQLFVLFGAACGAFTFHGPLGGHTVQWWFNNLTLAYLFGYQVAGFALETGLWARAPLYSVYAAVFSFLAWTPALVWACFTVFRKDWIFHTPHVAGPASLGEGAGRRRRTARALPAAVGLAPAGTRVKVAMSRSGVRSTAG
jgi:cellulose synthase/poly-beta-1,6-N-acetylglucosamine synthase-like glycosyltransferase